MRLSSSQDEQPILFKLKKLNWGLIFLVCLVAGIGFAMLYSAAHGNSSPWMDKQVIRFGFGFLVMIGAAFVRLKHWMLLAYPAYLLTFMALVYVEFAGEIGMGAQRWIDLKYLQLQPSELMKIVLVMALARYFQGRSPEMVRQPQQLIIPILMVGLPVGLVLKQPDLGTAGILLMLAASIFFIAGVKWWKFVLVFVVFLCAVPIVWENLHDYQKNRIHVFLNPELDALGRGYHITQSKIALGSGGITGRGYLQGSQSHLDFLPERQTDFIFTMFAEEFGMVGGLALLMLYSMLVLYGFVIALRSRSQFGRLLAAGLSVNLFLYFFINIAMVTGLIPVVGVPLPLLSYGGTALLSVMVGFGLMMAVNLSRDVKILSQ